MTRDEAITLVSRLMNAEPSDEESTKILDALHQGSGCPQISDYIYWPSTSDPTAEQIVDRALSYKPIAL
ncbi:e9imm peptide [Streptomyces sp. SP18ES09]|uniref:e9imm peptide n=1 Tax=Streptomyces sp. SP18ES09 TaxID=3002532 RepID=UPI002E792908|nr:e9imm peptide [Streptomyces sp. SP18ES09]MEE1818305.1 e9imm peptide [Streptomyces sp. SP18ES09]